MWSRPESSLVSLSRGDINVRLLSESGFSLSPGTHLRFHGGSNVEWQDIKDLESAEEDSADEERSTSLKVHNTHTVLSGTAYL